MLNHNKIRKFGRERKVRVALMRSLAHNLILNEKIITTEAKAKSLRPYVEKLITHAKTDSVAKRRLIGARLGNDTMAMKKLFDTLGPRFAKREGGYTRIVRVGVRSGDGAVKAYIGFV
ncbi:TPA: 50S ribosomal protein L17 [Patescibacteria group bacterium]|nr:50S ribosomal protein L17 [Patescibacteria group bacterium]